MSEMYDWVGSLAKKPEHFELQDFSGKVFNPSDVIEPVVLKVIERDSPLEMSHNGEIAFQGFGVKSTDSQCSPEVLYDAFEQLKKKMFTDDGISREKVTEMITKENIYIDMINLFSEKDFSAKTVCFEFLGENGLGEGISKDYVVL